MKVALGCGARYYGDGWTHIDGGLHPHTISHKRVDILPFADNSVDLLYASHLIAYFDRIEFTEILKEWHRILKPGGTIRLATPDFSTMACMYVGGECDLADILGPLYGRMEMLGGGRIYHKTVWTIGSLRSALNIAGFKDVDHYDWRQTEHANVDDHSQAYLDPKGNKEIGTLISLNIEAKK